PCSVANGCRSAPFARKRARSGVVFRRLSPKEAGNTRNSRKTMSQVVHKTVFNPNPVQRNFIESRAKADLFSSRMGEGKSTAIAWACLYHTRHNPGAS